MHTSWGQPPFLVGLAGASGSGKSTLARALVEKLGPHLADVLPLDSYYRDQSNLNAEARSQLNFDQPNAWEIDRLRRDLLALQSGCAIELPVYDFATHSRLRETRLLRPKPILIAEGVFALAIPEIAQLFDLRIGLTISLDLCLQRRIERDTQERARTESSIRAQFDQQVRPAIEKWVLPSIAQAELALVGDKPVNELVGQILPHLPKVEDPAGQLPVEFAELARRLGPELLSQRLERQSSLWAGKQHQGEGLLVIERYLPIDRLITTGLKLTGLYHWGHRQAMNVRTIRHQIISPQVPPALDGFRLLQLSDLHLDIDPALTPAIRRAIAPLEYDLAVITGDYRNSTSADFSPAIQAMSELLPSIRSPRYGILGNHDFLEMAPALEALGLPMLLNEGVLHHHAGAEVFLGGIDDPHFYATDDLPRVRSLLDQDSTAFRILLSHSPETYHRAEGFHLLLAGHTHGGQICLPGGLAILRLGRCPAAMLSGAWQHHDLMGYTSPGTGCCGVPVRFFCPPEVTLHEFHHGLNPSQQCSTMVTR